MTWSKGLGVDGRWFRPEERKISSCDVRRGREPGPEVWGQQARASSLEKIRAEPGKPRRRRSLKGSRY